MADNSDRAYVAGLTLLSRREMSESQLRARLARRKHEPESIDQAVARLRRDRSLDDRRAALACARTEVALRGRGKARVLRRVEAMGIARDVAREAVNEVFAELDEGALIEAALERRLRRGVSLNDPAALRRIHGYLLRQGFDASRVSTLLRKRTRHAADLE